MISNKLRAMLDTPELHELRGGGKMDAEYGVTLLYHLYTKDYKSFADLVECALDWDQTDEGFTRWHDIFDIAVCCCETKFDMDPHDAEEIRLSIIGEMKSLT